MDELSEEAQNVLHRFRSARLPDEAGEAQAWSMLQNRLREEERSVPVVTREFIRRRRFRGIWRATRRGMVVGTAVIGLILVVEELLPGIASRNLLAEAEDLLQANRPTEAYRVLVDHSQRFPTRDAAEERMGLVVDVLCTLGRSERARGELDRYLERVADSRHADRAADPCAGIVVSSDSPVPTRTPHGLAAEDMPADEQFGVGVRGVPKPGRR